MYLLDKVVEKTYAGTKQGLKSQRGVALVEWDNLQRNIGATFDNLPLLQQAFVHSSYINENPDFPLSSNERLEFLGDALLNFVVAEKLYSLFPSLSEGEMTKIRATLVRQSTLAELASSLRLGDYLFLGKGEEKSGGKHRQSNLAHVLEALIGVIFMERGFAVAQDFIWRLLSNQVSRMMEGEIDSYKSKLQELIQANLQVTPKYRTTGVWGPEHDKEFTVEVVIEDAVIGKGKGRSKQEAEEEAAHQAWEAISRPQVLQNVSDSV